MRLPLGSFKRNGIHMLCLCNKIKISLDNKMINTLLFNSSIVSYATRTTVIDLRSEVNIVSACNAL